VFENSWCLPDTARSEDCMQCRSDCSEHCNEHDCINIMLIVEFSFFCFVFIFAFQLAARISGARHHCGRETALHDSRRTLGTLRSQYKTKRQRLTGISHTSSTMTWTVQYPTKLDRKIQHAGR
jgi:hypothetical protein